MNPHSESTNRFSVALILGSARREGWTRKLAAALVSMAPRQLAFRPIEIADLPLYHEDLEVALPLQWTRFRSEIRAVDALLFVTPEYNRSTPAALKNAIDVGSAPDDESAWRGKPAGVISFSPGMLGGFGANHHLRQSLVFLDVPVLQQPEVYLSRIDQLFDENGVLRAGRGKQLLSEFLSEYAAWVALILSKARADVPTQ